jgi:hypothetical protein
MLELLAAERACLPCRVTAPGSPASRGRRGQQSTAPENPVSGQRGTLTDGGSDVAEINGTPLGQRLRRPGDHEPDAMRAQSGCHSQARSYCRPAWPEIKSRRHGHSSLASPSTEAAARATASAINPPVTSMHSTRAAASIPATGAAPVQVGPAQVGVAVSSTWWFAVISNLLIGLAVLGIEPAYQTLPSSAAVVHAATWVRVPSGWTTQS